MDLTLCKEYSFQTASSGIVWNGPIKDLGGSRKDYHLSMMYKKMSFWLLVGVSTSYEYLSLSLEKGCKIQSM